MRALVIGYGSIGERHARILSELGCKVAVVSHREIPFPLSYKSISAAIQAEASEYVVIANRTDQHFPALIELSQLGYRGMVLIEKPIFDGKKSLPNHSFKSLYVAYNLRFHPIIQRIKELLETEKIISVQVYAGQYLPTWRPMTDYSQSYSAKKALGGGVLRDLSHELDYINWLLGGWTSLAALGGQYSHLEIDSDDVFNIMLSTNKAPIVNIQINYLDRTARREIVINTDRFTLKADLIKNSLQINQDAEAFDVDRDLTYSRQHHAVLQENDSFLCTVEEAVDVMEMIAAAEISAGLRKWVSK